MLLQHKYILLLDLQRRQTKAMGSRPLRHHFRTTVTREFIRVLKGLVDPVAKGTTARSPASNAWAVSRNLAIVRQPDLEVIRPLAEHAVR